MAPTSSSFMVFGEHYLFVLRRAKTREKPAGMERNTLSRVRLREFRGLALRCYIRLQSYS